ncbi:aminotransferase class I/II-fold pyridoxal phosphate-dependent enzyme [Aeriscardovia aeriphila]|uniref:cysteine-S-conjugate beta-lyase n=1 Tax=Aeriscardovia aeriphila TaxID=218139 RepID=A0A261FC68_9BIFI|nr:aminotransferase class I/II-fold pyridoxal phosphate-dependent enzyme [Aeriscardovia aeriphila]NYI25360.1 cystathionine beta-lyase [Aeriscardovia aeriphila]OZG56486.1 aminotransferase, class I/II [Aeriscardovia aeriphila]
MSNEKQPFDLDNLTPSSENLFAKISVDEVFTRRNRKWGDKPSAQQLLVKNPAIKPKWAEKPIALHVAEMDVPLAPAVGLEMQDLLNTNNLGYISHLDGEAMEAAYVRFAKRRWNADVHAYAFRCMDGVIASITAVVKATLGQRIEHDPTATNMDGRAQYEGTVMVFTPAYPQFLHRVTSGHSLRQIPFTPAHRPDLEALEQVCKELAQHKPQAPSETGYNAVLVLCSPNNPTGTIYTREELTQICKIAARWHVRIVADEIHSPLEPKTAEELEAPHPYNYVPLLSLPEAGEASAIVAFSATKGYAIPSFRACLLMASEDPAAQDLIMKFTRREVEEGTHEGSLVEAAAMERGDDWLDQLNESIEENRLLLSEAIARKVPHARLIQGEGTHLTFLDLTSYLENTCWDSHAGDALLENCALVCSAGSDFGGPQWGNWVRVNEATNPAVVLEAVDRMAEWLRTL